MKELCPVCYEGDLTEQLEGITLYSVCDHCGSEVVNATQAKLNKSLVSKEIAHKRLFEAAMHREGFVYKTAALVKEETLMLENSLNMLAKGLSQDGTPRKKYTKAELRKKLNKKYRRS